MATKTLILDAINNRRSWKQIGDELTALPPDSEGAQTLVSSFRDGSCEPWMAAFLLGCVGDPAGYETALEILVSDAGSLSGSYASVAMVAMRGGDAYPDLLEILTSDRSRRVRQDAVYGMARINPPQLLDDLYSAHCTGKLSRKSASWHIAYCEPSDEWLAAILQSKELDKKKLGCAVVDAMVRANTPMDSPGNAIAADFKLCLEDGELTMMMSRRKRLQDWAGEVDS